MGRKILLVQGDTAPLLMSITDPATGLPVDLSEAGAAVTFRMRPVPQGGVVTTIKATVVCSKLVGVVREDGSIDTAAPYNVPGAGGRCQVDWGPTDLDTAGEFEAEVEVTLKTGKIKTIYKLLYLTIRAQFA